MKRFAYVSADAGIPLPGTKGSSIHVESLCAAFAEAGLDGEIYTPRRAGDELAGLPIHALPAPTESGGSSPTERERAQFLAGDPNRIAAGARPDFIYERYSLWHTAGLARARALGVPFILEVNSPLPEEARRYRTLHNEELARGIARLLLEESDGVVAVSRGVAEWARSIGARDRRVWIVPNGVDADLFRPRRGVRPHPLPPAPTPLVAFCGSFRPWHGIDNLLEAFAILRLELCPEVHLVCVGDGPERAPFAAALAEHRLAGAAHLIGQVAHLEVPAWIGGADVAVAPYPKLEDFYFSPLKIFEFMALGLPVVAGAVGQVLELIPDGERGRLAAPGDARALAMAIAGLLADRVERERLGAAARRWVLDHATWQRRAREILAHIEERT